ncbi:TolC family protein [Aquirhabdus sp.]|uniref:TolC family protein n=1 Tax=Aquirhabdus sp. TaxID=2824160 RepID=UPI00396C6265
MSPFLIHRVSIRPVLRYLLPVVLVFITGLADAVPLSLDAALTLAEQNAPELIANHAQIDTAQSTSIPAGALPNPKVFAGLDNFPVTGAEAGQLTRDNMTMQKIGIMQDTPNAAKRRAQIDISQASIEVATAQLPITRLKIRENTATAWFNRYYLERKVALFDTLFNENQRLAQAVHAQIAAGRGSVTDGLLPKQEAAQLADQRDDLQRDLSKAKAALRRYLGIDSTAPSSDPILTPDAPALTIDAEHLHQHLHHHPELQAFAAESQLADAKLAAARSLKKSDMSVEFGYLHRAPQFGDMIAVQLTYELPIFSAHRVDPLIMAAQSEQAQIDAQREVMLREHAHMLENDLADYTALSQQLDRANHISLPLAQQKVDLQLASYQAGKADLSMVLTARREWIEQQLKIITLENMRAVTAAQLYYSYGDMTTTPDLQGANIQ